MSIQWKLRDDKLAVITLNRPETLNALSFSILQALDDALTQVEQSEARGLIIIGSGDKAFCAGADIPELMNRPLMAQSDGAQLGQAVFSRINELKVPSVAVVHGFAFGGGLELALACTFRIGTNKLKVGLPEVKLGLIPGYGGTQRLPRIVGQAIALDMILSGRTVLADEALQIGLINRITQTESTEQAGADFLAPMIEHGQLALYFAREAVLRGMQTTLQEGLRIERDLSTLAYQTADANEGMLAFTEKRKPVFKDQ